LAFTSTEVENRFRLAKAAEPTFADVEIEPKSTNKYSTFADQFYANAHSIPPPAVQPARVSE
jgi:hypothetical protein